jgi:hypothetical protein
MAQTRKKRRRKHRGTQGGSIDRRGRSGRPQSREQARAQARRNSELKRTLAPTWGSAFKRGLFGAVIFFILAATLLGQTVAGALVLSGVMLAMYTPIGYYMDRFFYRRRLEQARREAQARKQAR